VEQKLQTQERLQGLLLQQQEQLLHPFNTQTLELLLQSHEAATLQQTDTHTKQICELNDTLARRQQEVEQQFAAEEKELKEKMAQVSAEEQATDEKWKQSEQTIASLRTELATIDEKLATQEL
jgi:CHASE3 domain sensor protein